MKSNSVIDDMNLSTIASGTNIVIPISPPILLASKSIASTEALIEGLAIFFHSLYQYFLHIDSSVSRKYRSDFRF